MRTTRGWIGSGERRGLVPHTGFEPVISALRGRCPGPLDECGPVGARRDRRAGRHDTTRPATLGMTSGYRRLTSRKVRIASATC
jgi:hypothetical protein